VGETCKHSNSSYYHNMKFDILGLELNTLTLCVKGVYIGLKEVRYQNIFKAHDSGTFFLCTS
jgi:hypothetical protein